MDDPPPAEWHLSWVAIEDVVEHGKLHGATAECFDEDDVLTAVAVKPVDDARAWELVHIGVVGAVRVPHEAGRVGADGAVADVDLGWREAGAATLEGLVFHQELLVSGH